VPGERKLGRKKRGRDRGEGRQCLSTNWKCVTISGWGEIRGNLKGEIKPNPKFRRETGEREKKVTVPALS